MNTVNCLASDTLDTTVDHTHHVLLDPTHGGGGGGGAEGAEIMLQNLCNELRTYSSSPLSPFPGI